MFGYQPGVKEGFLRIKKGETDFDKSYCFTLADVNLVGVKGNKTSYAYMKVYGGNGKVYAYLNIPGAASNPPDYVHDKCFQPFEINLYSKSCTKLDLSATTGWAAPSVSRVMISSSVCPLIKAWAIPSIIQPLPPTRFSR